MSTKLMVNKMEKIKRFFEVIDLKVIAAVVGGAFFLQNARFMLDCAGFFFLLKFVYENLVFADDRRLFMETFFGNQVEDDVDFEDIMKRLYADIDEIKEDN